MARQVSLRGKRRALDGQAPGRDGSRPAGLPRRRGRGCRRTDRAPPVAPVRAAAGPRPRGTCRPRSVASGCRRSGRKTSGSDCATSRSARRIISCAARRLNVSSRMRAGSTPLSTSQATRCASVAVLPVPAPAMISSGVASTPPRGAEAAEGHRLPLRIVQAGEPVAGRRGLGRWHARGLRSGGRHVGSLAETLYIRTAVEGGRCTRPAA